MQHRVVGGVVMAEQQTYEFVEVKSADILAERQREWSGFTAFLTWGVGFVVTVLILLYLFLG
jgi:hypothetical protein